MIHEEAEFRRALKALRLEAPALVMDDVDRLFEALMAISLVPTGERFHHTKRGTTYDILGVGHANSAVEIHLDEGMYGIDDFVTLETGRVIPNPVKALFDRDEIIIYRDVQSGALSIRARDEFLDGRFTPVQHPGARTSVDPARALVRQPDKPARKVAASAALGAAYGASPKSELWVIYDGTEFRYKGRVGRAYEWDGDGYVKVDWSFNSVAGQGNPDTHQNALNIRPAPFQPGNRIRWNGRDGLVGVGSVHHLESAKRVVVTWDIEGDPMPRLCLVEDLVLA